MSDERAGSISRISIVPLSGPDGAPNRRALVVESYEGVTLTAEMSDDLRRDLAGLVLGGKVRKLVAEGEP